jgi:hypothetical protein
MAQVNHFPVGGGKPLHGGSERPDFLGRGATSIRVRSRSRKPLEHLVCSGGLRVATLASGVVAQAIHGNPKQPTLKAPALNVINQFGCNRAKHGLGDLFSKFWISPLRAQQAVHPARVFAHQDAPGSIVATRSPGENRC